MTPDVIPQSHTHGDSPPATVPLAIRELVRIASMGGGRGISLGAQPRGSLGATGKPFEIFAKNMFAGCLGALPSNVDTAWKRTFSWLGSLNAPPDFMIWNGDAVEVKQQGGVGQIALNSSPPKQTLKVDDPRIEEACRTCENWVEKDFLYFIGKTNPEFVEALWLVDGRCMADNADVYDLIFGNLSVTVSSLGGQPTNELGRFNRVDALKSTSLRIRAMWSIEHPATTFKEHFSPPKSGHFVLNVLISAKKWDAYPVEQIAAVQQLSDVGVTVKRMVIADASSIGQTHEVIHIGWTLKLE